MRMAIHDVEPDEKAEPVLQPALEAVPLLGDDDAA